MDLFAYGCITGGLVMWLAPMLLEWISDRLRGRYQ